MTGDEMDADARAGLDEAIAGFGWCWSSEQAARAWTTRIWLRMAAALLDPCERAGERAAREAFVDGLVDARRAGAIVPGHATIDADARPPLSLVDAPRRAVRLRAGAVRRPPRRVR